MRRIVCVALLVFGTPLGATAEAPAATEGPTSERAEAVVAEKLQFQGRGKATYEVVHPMHDVRGVSEAVEVRAVVGEEGLQLMARAPVRSFDSGNGNRDKHVLEVVRADRHPMVIVRGLASGFRLPKVGESVDLTLRSQVELAGVVSTPAIQATVTRVEAGRLSVRFRFEDRLSDHDIDRPRLLMIPVRDEFSVEGEIVLERSDAVATK